ncbi:MAG: hypothetical protein AAF633_10515, partial [Chloroflexota bacterium]
KDDASYKKKEAKMAMLKTEKAILTMLVVRLVMDVLDTLAGFQSGLLALTAVNLLSPAVMFLIPNIFSIWYLMQRARS